MNEPCEEMYVTKMPHYSSEEIQLNETTYIVRISGISFFKLIPPKLVQGWSKIYEI
jgi:hypothetical protein